MFPHLNTFEENKIKSNLIMQGHDYSMDEASSLDPFPSNFCQVILDVCGMALF